MKSNKHSVNGRYLRRRMREYIASAGRHTIKTNHHADKITPAQELRMTLLAGKQRRQ